MVVKEARIDLEGRDNAVVLVEGMGVCACVCGGEGIPAVASLRLWEPGELDWSKRQAVWGVGLVSMQAGRQAGKQAGRYLM